MREIKTVPRWESLKRALTFVENPIPVVNDALETYGSTYFTRFIGGRKIVMTIEPDIAQHVLQKNNKNYAKSELQTDSLGRYVGLGLLTANGEYWLRQRRLIQPGFHKIKLEKLVTIMRTEIDAFMDDLHDRVKQNTTVNITQSMMELTLRVVSKSLFSTGISSDKIMELGDSINELQRYIVKEVRMPFAKIWRDLNGSTARAGKLSKEVRGLLQDIIDQRKIEGVGSQNDLLDMLLEARYEDNGEGMSDTQILDEVIILFVAGYETTANTLAWCLHSLREHPAIQSKLIETLDFDIRMDMSTMMSPSYLTQVLDETMRKYPAAWILDRVALGDDEIDGVTIKKGDVIGLYVFGTQRNPMIWTDPETFDPDRFRPEEKKQYHNYSYFPFGGGPRMCIGYQFAIMEMKMTLIGLLRRFELPPPHGSEPEYLPLITLKSKENIYMDLKLKVSKA